MSPLLVKRSRKSASYCSRCRWSFGGYAGVFHDLATAFDICLQELRKVIRRGAERLDPLDRKGLAYVSSLHDVVHDFLMQSVHELNRRSRGNQNAVPYRRLVSWKSCFVDGGKVRENGPSIVRGHAEGSQLSGLDVRHDGRRDVKHELELSAEQIRDRLRHALIRHVHHARSRQRFEHLTRHVPDRS